MPKRATPFELILPVRPSETPAYRWLYDALRGEILEGRLRPGARLPGTRDLGAQYGLSRGTIVSAFDQLESEGYVEGNVGSGTYVSTTLPEELETARGQRTPEPTGGSPRRKLSSYARRVTLFSALEVRPSRAFRPNLPAVDLFPIGLWAQITARLLRRASTGLLVGCDPMGYKPLRQAVADYLTASRGVKCGPAQVVIVSGVQEGLDLVARLFLNPGDRVCMEEPGYTGAAIVFEGFAARIAAAPMDDEGIQLRSRWLRGARLVYVTPAHQFPLGTTMSLARRLALLDWARKSGALIFEDDYDGEYRYSTRPVPALQVLDRHGLVLFAGSFSKVLFPSLRLGYLVIPEDLLPRFEAAKSVTSRHPPVLEQAVLCDFITEGHFGRHLRRMRQVYAERLSVLLEGARERLAGLLEISSVEAGLQTAGWLGGNISGESAAIAAAARGVEVTPLSRYSRRGRSREGLQLGFAAVDSREIRRGVRELGIALEAEARPPRDATPYDGAMHRPSRSVGFFAAIPALLISVLAAVPVIALTPPAQVPETVHFTSGDGVTRLTGYLFLPSGRGRHGAVVMMHGRHGSYSSLARGVYTAETLTKRHQQWGEFWAERGYVGLHVDGFGPRGHPDGFAAGTYKDRPGDIDEVMVRPLDAYGALRYLRTRADVSPDRVALQGWSNGASATLSAMARNAPGIQNPSPASGFRAALAFYPGCGLRDRYKKDYATYAPVLVFIAAEDEEVSPAICEELVATGQRSGADIAKIVYPGATHDFDDPGRARQRVEANHSATADAMRRAEAFLKAHLGSNP